MDRLYATQRERWGVWLLVLLIVVGMVYALFIRLRLEGTFRGEPPDLYPAEERYDGEQGNDGNQDAGVMIVVHVSGAVQRPGVYRLREDERVIDALQAAGGARTSADLDRLNLAAPLRDGQKVEVQFRDPSREGQPSQGPPEGTGKGMGGRININTATPDRLQEIPGVGEVIAIRIVEHRKAHGYFEATEDVTDVPGIGERTYQNMKDVITVY